MMIIPVNAIDCYMGRLEPGDDLLDALTAICVRRRIHLGKVEAIGAVRQAVTGFWDAGQGQYQTHRWEQPMEITTLSGNISEKDGKPFVHAHITFADARGYCVGGHLMPGTQVFACEFVIHAFGGGELVRQPDLATGLALWPLGSDTPEGTVS